MEKRSLKIFIACALGAGIGSLISLEIYKYFWWVGFIVGGFIGYLSYEFKKVISAAQRSWREIINYKPDYKSIARRFLRILSVSSMVIFPIVLCYLAEITASYISLLCGIAENTRGITFLILAFVPAIAWSISFIPALFKLVDMEAEVRKRENEKDRVFLEADWEKISLIISPLAMLIYWPLYSIFIMAKHTIKVVAWTGKKIPKFFKAVALFAKRVFILVHSDIRLLCGVDAAIGAGAGYFAGSVVVGMFAGGAFGVINYEIVSKRLLNLVPRQ